MSKNILIVEDDEDILRNLKRLLESEGYNVEVANNGQHALAQLLASQELPALIILDLMMPVMDGFQFKKIQDQTPRLASIPVLIMTADGHTEEKRLKTGSLMALKKPADIDEILEAVRTCMAA